MNSEWFEKVIKEQIKTCEDVLIGKAKEYATDDDRLHNFKNAAGMMSCDPKEALAGMMAKHTISVYDMCRSGKDYPIELWNEKITDHINYLLLLKAIVEEENSPVGKTKGYLFTDFIKDILWPNYRSQFTFDGKTVEIKEPDEKHIQDVIDGLRYCNADTCNPCYKNEENDAGCIGKLREDAAELLEKYKSIIGNSASKNKENTPKIKEDSEALDEAIKSFRRTLTYCATAKCEYCHHYHDLQIGENCDKGLLDEFNNIIIRLKDEKNAT